MGTGQLQRHNGIPANVKQFTLFAYLASQGKLLKADM